MSKPFRWIKFENRLRCTVGVHDLVGMKDAGDGVHVIPIDPRGFPGPGCIRRCNYCGARWETMYDGMGASWVKTRGPLWSRAEKRRRRFTEQRMGRR